MKGYVSRLMGHRAATFPEVRTSMELLGKVLMLTKGLVVTWEFRTWLGWLSGEGRRVQSFLLCRWNYAGSSVFVVRGTSWQDRKERQELRRDKPASSWDLGTALWQQVSGFPEGVLGGSH